MYNVRHEVGLELRAAAHVLVWRDEPSGVRVDETFEAKQTDRVRHVRVQRRVIVELIIAQPMMDAVHVRPVKRPALSDEQREPCEEQLPRPRGGV